MAISKQLILAAAVACGAAFGPVAAQETVEDRKAVLDAQIDLLKKQSEVNKLLREVAGSSAMGLPVVLSVSEGQGGRLARLQLANGIAGYYREGEVVQHGMVVGSISGRSVYVRIGSGRGGKAVLLDFASRNAAMPGAQSQPVANDALLPSPPVVKVPPIEVLPTPRQDEAKAGK